ncbi:MAG: hypothetical protein FWE13_02900 [Firmicutes bacterium]|nr:hypothetical protein [Bacillota bacterium]
MKKFIRNIAIVVSVLLVSITVLVACNNWTDRPMPQYDRATQIRLEETLDIFLDIMEDDLFWNSEVADWWNTTRRLAHTSFVDSLREARITQTEVNEILDIIDMAMDIRTDQEAMEFFESLANASVPSRYVAAFLFELLNALDGVATRVINNYRRYFDNADIREFNEMRGYVRQVLDLGRTTFLDAFGALIGVYRLNFNFTMRFMLMADTPDFRNETEFVAIMGGMRDDMLAQMELLTPAAFNAFGAIANVFVPNVVASSDVRATRRLIDDVVALAPRAQASERAMLNAMNANFFRNFHRAIYNEQIEYATIQIGRILHIGLNASGGLTQEQFIQVFTSYVRLLDISNSNREEVLAEMRNEVDNFVSAVNFLNGISGTEINFNAIRSRNYYHIVRGIYYMADEIWWSFFRVPTRRTHWSSGQVVTDIYGLNIGWGEREVRIFSNVWICDSGRFDIQHEIGFDVWSWADYSLGGNYTIVGNTIIFNVTHFSAFGSGFSSNNPTSAVESFVGRIEGTSLLVLPVLLPNEQGVFNVEPNHFVRHTSSWTSTW